VSGFVLDASVTMAWCFADEASAATWAILARLEREGAAVPSLCPLEVGNILTKAERRQRTTPARISRFLVRLGTLPIRIDDETTSRAWRETLALARTEGLTTYDAAYLELALRRGLPLATRDGELRQAAARNGVGLLPD
jgi:predicted nucleic acid-binding protein